MNANMKSALALLVLVFTVATAAQADNQNLPKSRYLKQGDGYWVVLKVGDNVLESLKALARQEKIPSASFTGVGMVKNTTLGVFDPIKKEHVPHSFADPMEMGSISGNIYWRDEQEPFVHAHGVLADVNTSAHAGHIMDSTVAVTMELYVSVKSARVGRGIDPDLGAPVMQLP